MQNVAISYIAIAKIITANEAMHIDEAIAMLDETL